jgi:hypothetical protein
MAAGVSRVFRTDDRPYDAPALSLRESPEPASPARETVYIHATPAGPPNRTCYQHTAVALAEGLTALGVPVFSNIDYWRLGPDSERTLLRRDPDVTPGDCSVVVATSAAFSFGEPVPPELERARGRAVLAFVDDDDGVDTPCRHPPFDAYDVILRAQFNESLDHPPRTHPWAFGLTARILDAIGPEVPPLSARARTVVANFRVDHQVRALARPVLARLPPALSLDESMEGLDDVPTDPGDALAWAQTGRRHQPAYYRRLRNSFACAAFGGMFLPRGSADRPRRRSIGRRLQNRLDPRPRALFQWDSWRLWEGLAAGCLVLHVDLGAHGARLPVMPEPWVHYAAVDLKRPEAAIERLRAEPELCERVAAAGRMWALDHYAPAPTASRLLEHVRRFRAGEDLGAGS